LYGWVGTMQPMKRVFLFLFGTLAVLVLAPLDVSLLGGGVRVAPADVSAMTATSGGGGGGASAPAAASTVITGGGGPVCVALPVLAGGSQGSCATGEVEIPNDPGSGGAIVFYLKLFLKFLNGLIGAIIILVLVVAGIQYITSVGEPANVKSAKKRVMNATIALVLYLMMFAILNFLVPGGILS
jgi:hypothetical protein